MVILLCLILLIVAGAPHLFQNIISELSSALYESLYYISVYQTINTVGSVQLPLGTL
jgi:hypothetical protein